MENENKKGTNGAHGYRGCPAMNPNAVGFMPSSFRPTVTPHIGGLSQAPDTRTNSTSSGTSLKSQIGFTSDDDIFRGLQNFSLNDMGLGTDRFSKTKVGPSTKSAIEENFYKVPNVNIGRSDLSFSKVQSNEALAFGRIPGVNPSFGMFGSARGSTGGSTINSAASSGSMMNLTANSFSSDSSVSKISPMTQVGRALPTLATIGMPNYNRRDSVPAANQVAHASFANDVSPKQCRNKYVCDAHDGLT